MTVQWRKSSASGGVNDEACVEVAPVSRHEVTDLMTRLGIDLIEQKGTPHDASRVVIERRSEALG
jgi:hypothetical protein